jgi:hypothetical protein
MPQPFPFNGRALVLVGVMVLAACPGDILQALQQSEMQRAGLWWFPTM